MKNKIFYIVWLLYTKGIFAYSKVNKQDIIPSDTLVINEKEWVDSIDSVLWYVRDSIWWLLALIAIAVFIWVWFRLIVARWNPEEFKKALMQFIYAVVWIVIVALAWVIVKMASSLNF